MKFFLQQKRSFGFDFFVWLVILYKIIEGKYVFFCLGTFHHPARNDLKNALGGKMSLFFSLP